jgi:coniferyl-aldehyde dehydrogenase
MINAAQNLVPVTLELGGKNPTVFTADGITKAHIEGMMGIKLTKNGQLCITVDHCYVPARHLDQFIGLVTDYINERAGDYTRSELNCSVINSKQFDRLQRYVDEVKATAPETVIELGSPAERGEGGAACRMPFTLVINPAPGSLLDQNEVFGPVLPVLTYENFDDVERRIQAGERPLGVYIFSTQTALIERLQRNTTSGGFVANGAALQGAQENLGFGGVGKSGMGRHHGIEGFREFSNPRGCVEVADDASLAPLMSPHDEATRQFISAATEGALD